MYFVSLTCVEYTSSKLKSAFNLLELLSGEDVKVMNLNVPFSFYPTAKPLIKLW